jgi:hypothetical protein
MGGVAQTPRYIVAQYRLANPGPSQRCHVAGPTDALLSMWQQYEIQSGIWLLCFCLQELFKEKHYMDLEGGILEGFGRLLKFDLKVITVFTWFPRI